MRLKTRVLIIVMASLVGLVVMGVFGLYSMRQSMMQERRAQITQLLDFADSQLKYFQGLEAAGTLTQEEAQQRAKEAIGNGMQDKIVVFEGADEEVVVASLLLRADRFFGPLLRFFLRQRTRGFKSLEILQL